MVATYPAANFPTVRLLQRARRLLLFFPLCLLPSLGQAQAPPDTIGRITGDDISVARAGGTVSPQDPRTIFLASGSEITVHSGQARIELVNGGEIGVCGPSKLTLLESGGAFTLAMDFGRVRVHLEGATPLTIYTPLVAALPLAVADGPRDATVGVAISGPMCVRAASGGIRLQQQLTNDTIIVPQPEELLLENATLRPTPVPGGCSCEILQARLSPRIAPVPRVDTPAPSESARNENSPAAKTPLPVAQEYSVPARPGEIRHAENATPPNLPATQMPVWKVLMPPLRFDANAPPPSMDPVPAPSLETILLVREVRVEPEWAFRGRVEPEEDSATNSPRAEQQKGKAGPSKWNQRSPKKNRPGGIREFFRRLFGADST
jgi:hypothetical protein